MLRLAPWYLHVLHPYAAGFLQRLPVLRLLAVHCAFRLGSGKVCTPLINQLPKEGFLLNKELVSML